MRGCAQEVQRNLGHDFEVHGIVEPGAESEIIVNRSTKITGKFTKKDVVWGGTRDVGRNKMLKRFHQIKNLVKNPNQTNVIVMSVPRRHDLEPKWRVNGEVKVYNRKLKKTFKGIWNTCVIEVDSNTDLFTRHGLHINSKGKEQIAKKIVKMIKAMLNKKKSDPIMMKDEEELGADNEGTETETITLETETNQKQSIKDMQANRYMKS